MIWLGQVNWRLTPVGLTNSVKNRRIDAHQLNTLIRRSTASHQYSPAKFEMFESSSYAKSRIQSTFHIQRSNELDLTNSSLYIFQFLKMAPTLPSFTLAGRTVIVTGGAQGLGFVMGRGLVLSGAEVAIVDLQKEAATKQAAVMTADFEAAYPGTKAPLVTAHYADVADEASVIACVAEVVKVHGKVDGLVTSAGFTDNIPVLDYPIERVRKLWSVNVDGTYLFATNVARHLISRKAKGSFVFIGSMSGAIVNLPQRQTPYNTSKAAVRHLAASLAVEFAEHNIRVNCISPGYMKTPMTVEIMEKTPAIYAQWVGGVPQGRMGDPQDLAGPCAFLLSDAAAYVTGADLRVDGGFTVL
jgi:NAD(P)-dependent dehydrogenase (short-subunit alcohol dehydrogenase family)